MPKPFPTTTLTQSARVSFLTKELTFTYRDTGAPPGNKVYPTIFIIHGTYFHSGIFDSRLTPLAQKQGRLRLIYINRRDYQGSTEYDELEIEVLKGDFSHREREAFLTLEGVYLALLIDGLVRDLRLPTGAGLSVLGWSLGVSFTLAIMASANSDLLPFDAKARLQEAITSFTLWDPPNTSLGIMDPEGSYNIFTDTTIPTSEKSRVFMSWVTSYFAHGDLSLHDMSVLQELQADSTRPSTLHNMSAQDLLDVTELTDGQKVENSMAHPDWIRVVEEFVDSTLFNPDLRLRWPKARIWVTYNDATPYCIIKGIWTTQKRAAETPVPCLSFTVFHGANHMPMWDQPEKTLVFLASTISGSELLN